MRHGRSLLFGFVVALPLVFFSSSGGSAGVADGDRGGNAAAPGPAAVDSIPEKPYYRIILRRPGALPIGRGQGYAAVVFPESPFNVALTREGHYVYDLHVFARGLRPGRGVHVLWLTSPDLTRIDKVGVIDRESALRARVDFDNKFVLIITEEASAEVSRPTGRVVLRGISRSARMESMFSHGG